MNRFIERDETGKVKGIYAQRQPGYAEEEMADDAPELVAWRSARDNAARALSRLAEIDRISVRALREYVAAKADAPQILKDREAEAVAERAKLK